MDSGLLSPVDVAVMRSIDQPKAAAQHLYNRTALPGGVRKLWWRLMRRSPEPLLSLSVVCGSCELSERHFIGTQAVPLDQIRGSENRAQDFDRTFRPMRHHTRQRWVSVAMQNMRGISLPPVDLIRVGEVYFVRDGHHRVSVARALGQREARADVTVWEIACWRPLPWQATAPPRKAGQ